MLSFSLQCTEFAFTSLRAYFGFGPVTYPAVWSQLLRLTSHLDYPAVWPRFRGIACYIDQCAAPGGVCTSSCPIYHRLPFLPTRALLRC